MRINLNTRLDKLEATRAPLLEYRHMLTVFGRIDEIRELAKREHGIDIDAPDVMVIHIRAVHPGEHGPDSSDAVQGPPSVTVHL